MSVDFYAASSSSNESARLIRRQKRNAKENEAHTGVLRRQNKLFLIKNGNISD